MTHGRSVPAGRGVGALPVTGTLSIHPRGSWTDHAPLAPLAAEDVRFLLVHHTAGGTPSVERVPDELRSILRFHTGPEKGWPDVAYNFFIDPYGGVWEGRAGSLDGPVVADATGGSQGFAQLVCLLGDFTSALPTPEALDSLVRTLVWLATRYGIDTEPAAKTEFISRGSNRWPPGDLVTAATISGHRDMSQTACPGDTFYPYLVTDLRRRVHEEAVATATTTPSPAVAVTAATTTTTVVPTTVNPSTAAPTAPVGMTDSSDPTTVSADVSTAVPKPAERGSSAWPVTVGLLATAGLGLLARRRLRAPDDAIGDREIDARSGPQPQ